MRAKRSCFLRALRLLVALIASAPQLAAAQKEDQRARDLFHMAEARFREGDYDEAIRLFELAYEASPRASALFNIAAAHEMKPQSCLAARDAFVRFFRVCNGCSLEEKGRARMGKLEQRCNTKVSIETTPPGAWVKIDGETKGKTPYLFETWPLEGRLELEREGYQPVARILRVVEGAPVQLSFQLEKIIERGLVVLENVGSDLRVSIDGMPAQVLGPPGQPLPVGPHQIEIITPDQRVYPTFVQVKPGMTSTLDVGLVLEQARLSEVSRAPAYSFWASTSVAVVATGVGAGFFAARQSSLDERARTQSPSERSDLLTAANDQGLATTIAFSTAGTAAVVALVSWLWPTLMEGKDPAVW